MTLCVMIFNVCPGGAHYKLIWFKVHNWTSWHYYIMLTLWEGAVQVQTRRWSISCINFRSDNNITHVPQLFPAALISSVSVCGLSVFTQNQTFLRTPIEWLCRAQKHPGGATCRGPTCSPQNQRLWLCWPAILVTSSTPGRTDKCAG